MIKINIINRQLTLFFLFVVNISPSFRKGQITGVTSYHTQAAMVSNGNILGAQKKITNLYPLYNEVIHLSCMRDGGG